MGVPNAIVPNVVDDGPFGLNQFFTPDVDFIQVHHNNFVEKLRYYLKNPDLLEKIGQNCQKKAIEKFSWKERCANMLDEMQKAL